MLCRSRTRSRAGSAPRWTRWPMARRAFTARCWCPSPSCWPPGRAPAGGRPPSAPTRTAGRSAGLGGLAPARGRLPRRALHRRGGGSLDLVRGRSPHTRPRYAPPRRDGPGSRCSPRTSATTAAAVTRFVLVARPGPRRRRPARTSRRWSSSRRRPPGWPAGAARAVRRPRGQPVPHRVAADRGGAGLSASRSTSRATSVTRGSARR